MIADPATDGEAGDMNKLLRSEPGSYGPFVVAPVWLVESPVSDSAFRLWCYLAHWMDRDQRVTMADLRTAMSTTQQRVNRLLLELESAGAMTGHAEQGYVVFYARPEPTV